MERTEINIAVLILAAGASTRMGRTKQLLPWKHTTLLGHAIESAQIASIGNVYVVLGANIDAIKKSVGEYAAAFIHNKNWKQGLGSSIAVGTTFLFKKEDSVDGVLLMLADQPLLDSVYLNLLVARFSLLKNRIVATKYKNGVGVPAIFPAKYVAGLQKLKGTQGAKELLELHKKEVVGLDAGGKTEDVDTPAAYHRLRKALFY